MNKSELIEAISQNADISKASASDALEKIIDSMTSTLVQGESVNIMGFGSFQLRTRSARTGRNPKTGEAIQIKASRGVGFKAGKALKDAVNSISS